MAPVSLARYAPPPQTTNHAAPPQTINRSSSSTRRARSASTAAPAATTTRRRRRGVMRGCSTSRAAASARLNPPANTSATQAQPKRQVDEPAPPLQPDVPARVGRRRREPGALQRTRLPALLHPGPLVGIVANRRRVGPALRRPPHHRCHHRCAAAQGLADAATVVLTGASAGGIGVWINVDHLQSRLPHARVIGAPIAGFYAFAYPYTGAHHTSSTLADFREAAAGSRVALEVGAAGRGVAARGGGDAAAVHAVKLFGADSGGAGGGADRQRATRCARLGADGPPERYRGAGLPQRMEGEPDGRAAGDAQADRRLVQPRVLHPHGLPPRLHDPTTGKGYAYGDAFAEWLAATLAGGGAAPLLMDDCGLMCNPDCGVA